MKFTIRPKSGASGGGLSITAEEPREALERARVLVARGLTEVQIIDAAGNSYDLVELERLTSETENKRAP